MKTIEQLWKKLEKVELIQVRPQEMELMYKHCFEFEKPLFIEIGSAHGASSIILAEAAKELKGGLICIDHYPENYYDQDKFGGYARKAFKKNTKEYKNIITYLDMPSSEAINRVKGWECDILFIDGNHDYEAVKEDCVNFLPILARGGYVGFHDYNNVAFSGVKKAADMFCAGWEKESVWDLAVFKKP